MNTGGYELLEIKNIELIWERPQVELDAVL